MEPRAEVINDLLDSVVTAYALNNDPDEALESLAFYYQVERKLLQQILVDVYYSFIVKLTDLDLAAICGHRVQYDVLLKALVFMVVAKKSTPGELSNVMGFNKEDALSAYSIVNNHPGLMRLIEGYINCANRILAGPVC
ncbi:MAG: hypothetical protein HPY66_1384 [Firmicutes bacterium]|nr:hypothetical protein [Bacillota bacterium]